MPGSVIFPWYFLILARLSRPEMKYMFSPNNLRPKAVLYPDSRLKVRLEKLQAANMRKGRCSRCCNNTFRSAPPETQRLSNPGQAIRDDTGYKFLASVLVLSMKQQPGCGVGNESNEHEENRTSRSEGGKSREVRQRHWQRRRRVNDSDV